MPKQVTFTKISEIRSITLTKNAGDIWELACPYTVFADTGESYSCNITVMLPQNQSAQIDNIVRDYLLKVIKENAISE